jgi:flagellar biogenesis protein FliO
MNGVTSDRNALDQAACSGVRATVASLFRRLANLAFSRRGEQRLRMCEMLQLGEKRFIAVVEYGQDKFLVAGTPQTISLLKKFDGNCEKAGVETRAGNTP